MNKKITAILLVVIVVGGLSVVATSNAMPFMKWKTFPHMPETSNRPIQQSFVRLDGNVATWGTDEMKGTIQAQSRTVVFNVKEARQGATATAIWTNSTSRPISAIRTKENFTYVFYAARLVEANFSSINPGSNDFYMNGTWNVLNVTMSFNFTTKANGEVTGLHRFPRDHS